MDDRDKAIARYRAYIEEVQAAVPPDKLLLFKVTEGWSPLCRFLEVPEPDEPFPNLNDRETIKKIIAEIINGSYIMLGLSIACMLLVLAALLLWLG